MQTRPQTLGELANTYPSATQVFLRHRLDFCCGGRRTLAEACAQAGLDPHQIMQELETERDLSQPTPSADLTGWDTRPLPELTDHLVARYHERLRRDVPALIEAAQRVERVHAAKPDVPAGLAAHLTRVWAELQAHMAKEEQVLFPLIKRGMTGGSLYMPIRVMEGEHDAHGQDLARIRELTGELVTPGDACGTWRALYEGLRTLEGELMEHIHLENNVLFLRAVH
jgi:regulator of cell morphogenesis and NO signaling